MLLGIHLSVVALVLILTIVTLAWYTKNETANTSNAVIVAEPIDGVGLEDIVDNIVQYKGETGQGGQDAPYIATKIVSITQESTYVDDAVTCALSRVRVVLPDENNTEINESTSGYENIVDLFTFRVKVVTLNEDNTVNEVKGVFYPSDDGVLVDSNGNALTYQDDNYFTVTHEALSIKKTCTSTLQLELIFLDEASYKAYTSPGSGEITSFAFSSYDYMGSTFYATFEIGMEEGSRLIDTPDIGNT